MKTSGQCINVVDWYAVILTYLSFLNRNIVFFFQNEATESITYPGQMTELYEYSKSLGNPQFLLLPFQTYKLIYAFMLAEVGKISEALR